MTTEKPGQVPDNVVHILGLEDGALKHRDYKTDYARAQGKPVTNALLRLGLHPGFVDIYTQHLNDLNFTYCEEGERFLSEAQAASRLDVKQVFKPVAMGDEPNGERKRLFIVSKTEHLERQSRVASAVRTLGSLAIVGKALTTPVITKETRQAIRDVALDWIFAEQAMAALGNACHMQQTFGHYIADLNGQSPEYKTHLTLSTAYLKTLQLPEEQLTAYEDFERLKRGFGFVMLHESLLVHKVFEKRPQNADRLINSLRELDKGAYSAQQISAHLEVMKPEHDPTRRFRDFYFDSEDDDFETELDTDFLTELNDD